ncbi:MAG: low molecular weight phosphatase family protein [Microbacteriaceae bacterium]
MAAFAILTVCSGNICRSPLAEQLLRVGLAEWPKVEIRSAGTFAIAGDAMPREAAALSVRYGGDPSGHRASPLVQAQIRTADLVLGMARSHRREVVQLVPSSSRSVFTLREFARLAAGAPDEDFDEIAALPADDVIGRWRAAVEVAASRRGLERPARPEDDDVIDPYRGDQSLYDLSAEQLVPAARASALFLRRAATVRRD